ncbi:reverse transcriptase [Gossypium australe]|uniref:Reverse transcriptase n=1 Tax=Gossypium australe TaxID=47621 RepID=A0A5B6VTX3_9ROSI|nr:reverse transcriptase [Gossypium australe]
MADTLQTRTFRESLIGAAPQPNKAFPRGTDLLACNMMKVIHFADDPSQAEVLMDPKLYEELCRPWRETLIVRLLDKKVGYQMLTRRLLALWKPKGTVSFIDVGNEFYVVKFAQSEDYATVVTGGPWIVHDSYLTVRPWKAGFRPEEDDLSTTLVWIRIQGLPLEMFDEDALKVIGSAVGRPVKIDTHSALTSRGKFARVCVELSLNKPLISRVRILEETTSTKEPLTEANKPKSCGEQPKEVNNTPLNNATQDQYGTWVTVEKKRRPPRQHEKIFGKSVLNNGAEHPKQTSNGSMPPNENTNGLTPKTTGSANPFVALAASQQVSTHSPLSIPLLDISNNVDNRNGKRAGKTQGTTFKKTRTEGNKNSTKFIFRSAQEELQKKNAAPEKSFRTPSRPSNMHHTPVIERLQKRDKQMGCCDGLTEGNQTGATQTAEPSMQPLQSIANPLKPPDPLIPLQLTTPTTDMETDAEQEHIRTSTTQTMTDLTSMIKRDTIMIMAKDPSMNTVGNSPQEARPNFPFLTMLSQALLIIVIFFLMKNNNIITWNCCGAGHPSFRRRFRELIRKHTPMMVAILEPRVASSKAKLAHSRLNLKGQHFIEAEGFSGGIWLFWDTNAVQVDVLKSHVQFIHVRIKQDNDPDWLFTAVYASPNRQKRVDLWDELKMIAEGVDKPWLLAGDFNSIASINEKRGGAPFDHNSTAPFRNVINDLHLIDFGFVGLPFTWARGSSHQTRIQCRLDRTLDNIAAHHMWTECLVQHLPRLNSDHAPLLIRLNGNPPPNRALRPFRFQAAWLQHPEFNTFVQEKWNAEDHIIDALENMSKHCLQWNKAVFGNIFARKKRLEARIEGIQRKLRSNFDPGLWKLEKHLKEQLDLTLHQEETLWFQKSREKWIVQGDRNTKFFHTTTLIRRKRNKIEGLKNTTGTWITDPKALKQLTVDYFQKLFTPDSDIHQNHFRGAFPDLLDHEKEALGREFTPEDIRAALFQMHPNKAPGPNGFHALFFQKFWDTLEEAMCGFLLPILNGEASPEKVNGTLLTLIPKNEAPQDLTQFRPISLCNVLYKIIPKCLVNRIKPILPKLVSPNQSSFVPKRQITDNIIISQEVIHKMRKKTNHRQWMILKLDLEKAYDRVS